MTRTWAILLAVGAVASGCGSEIEGTLAANACALREEPGAACNDTDDNDCDGLVDAADPDCWDVCFPSDCPGKCHQQSDCGNIAIDQDTFSCVEEHCVSQTGCCSRAPRGRRDVLVTVDSTFQAASEANKPHSMIIRIVNPRRMDGRVYKRRWQSCSEILPFLGKTQATRSRAEQNPEINQIYRMLFELNWGGATSFFKFDPNAPLADGYIIGELWYGGPDNGQLQPTGNRASVTCGEIDKNGQLTFAFSAAQN